MNSTAQWSLKRPAYAAIINCSAQEYDTPSTINDEGDHCENRTGLPEQHHIICGVFERRIKSDEANPSEAVLGIRACNVPVREHQASAVLSCNVPVREHQGSAVRACNVPVQLSLIHI